MIREQFIVDIGYHASAKINPGLGQNRITFHIYTQEKIEFGRSF